MAKMDREKSMSEKAIDHPHPQPQPNSTYGCNNVKVLPLMQSLSKGNHTNVEFPPINVKESEIEHGKGFKKSFVAHEI
jgi:hypothetical protein